MALNIKNVAVEALASEVAEITGESKTEAVRRALVERLQRLESKRRLGSDAFFSHLERAVWPSLPSTAARPGRDERDAMLGYGPEGV